MLTGQRKGGREGGRRLSSYYPALSACLCPLQHALCVCVCVCMPRLCRIPCMSSVHPPVGAGRRWAGRLLPLGVCVMHHALCLPIQT